MNLRDRQDDFISDLALFCNWPEKYTFIIDLGMSLPAMPLHLQVPANRIQSCISRTFFSASIVQSCSREVVPSSFIHIYGASNAAIPAGIISIFCRIFNGLPPSQLLTTDINFHIISGLYDNLTYNRRLAIDEMINKIILLA